MPAKDDGQAVQKNQNEEMQSIQKLVRGCINSLKGGVSLRTLNNDYVKLVGEDIPFAKFGYTSLKNFLLDTPDVFSKIDQNGDTILSVNNEETQHISKLVSGQKGPKTYRKKIQFGFKNDLRLSLCNTWKANRSKNYDSNRNFVATGNKNFKESANIKKSGKNGVKIPSLMSKSLSAPKKDSANFQCHSNSFNSSSVCTTKDSLKSSNNLSLNEHSLKFSSCENQRSEKENHQSEKNVNKENGSFSNNGSFVKNYGIDNSRKQQYENGYSSFINNSTDNSNSACINVKSFGKLKEKTYFPEIDLDPCFEDLAVNVFCPIVGRTQLMGDDFFLQLSISYLDCYFVRKYESSAVTCGTVESGLSLRRAISKLKRISTMANRITICLGIVDIYENRSSNHIIDDMIELLDILHDKFNYTPSAITLCTTPPLLNLEYDDSSKTKEQLDNQFLFNDWIKRTAEANEYNLIDFFDGFLDFKGKIENSLFCDKETKLTGCNHSYVLWSYEGRRKAMEFLLNL